MTAEEVRQLAPCVRNNIAATLNRSRCTDNFLSCVNFLKKRSIVSLETYKIGSTFVRFISLYAIYE